MKWGDLTMAEKAEIMNIYVKGGVLNLNTIRQQYENVLDNISTQIPLGSSSRESNNNYKVGGQLRVLGPNMNFVERLYTKLVTPKNYTDEKTDITECAKWSNNQVGKITGKRPYGDAWTRSNNNVDKIISGYDGLTKPSEYKEKEVLDYLTNAADNVKNNIDLSTLKSGDLVGLYYNGSPSLPKSYNKGTNREAQTHTGHIIVEDGVPYVMHNIHGTIIKNKAEDVLGSRRPYGIVSVYRMRGSGGFLNSTPNIYLNI